MQKYKINTNIPKPPLRLETEKILPTLFLQENTKIQRANLDNYLELKHLEYDYESPIFSLAETHAIIAFQPLDIESAALSDLLRSQIPVILFDNSGNLLGRIEPNYPINPDLLQAQLQLPNSQKIQIMQAVVWATLRRYRRYLNRSSRSKAPEMLAIVKQMLVAIDSVHKQKSISDLQGSLGWGMSLYYQALPLCLNQDWGFKGPSDDSPVARMLQFARKLLEESIKTAVLSVGFNPHIGYWHSTYREQLGLIADFTHEFNLLAEASVIRTLNLGQIVPKDFDRCWNEDILPTLAVKAITTSYERKMTERFNYPHLSLNCSYQELLYLQAKQLSWCILGEIPEYYSLDLK